MAVTIQVGSNKTTNITGYSVSEDATPIDASDSSGGVGQLNISLDEGVQVYSQLYLNDFLDLEDGANGTTQGVVNSVQITNGVASLAGDSRIGAFLADRTAAPFTGRLDNAFAYYLGLVGITTGYTTDASIAATSVVFPGFTGNMWDYMKKMCVAMSAEISLVSDNIVLRPIRGRTAETARNTDISWSVSNNQLAQNVEVYYYNNEYKTDTMVYPKGGWTSDVQVYQVAGGETVEFDIPVDVSLVSIQQPTAIDALTNRFYTGPNSIYCIAGNDGAPIPAAQWAAGGGSLTVTINDDKKSLHVVLVGMNDFTGVGPFRVAYSSGQDTYSSLRIMGTGVFFDKKKITLPTGVPEPKSAQLVGVTIDNPFISTLDDAYKFGSIAAGKWASAAQTINVNTVGINRVGVSGAITYPMFSDFDTAQGVNTFDDFDTEQGANTFDLFNAEQFALVASDFDNQAFGNVAGARLRYSYSWYRIRSANITESSVSYSAERDTLFEEFDTLWTDPSGENPDTFATFTGNLSVGPIATFQDFAIAPLWRDGVYA
jgi:hypothetical protein